MRGFSLLLSILFSATMAVATEIPKGFTPEEMEWMAQQNQATTQFQRDFPSLFADQQDPLSFRLINETEARAFAEYEGTGYLIFSSEFHFASRAAKLKMAETLPDNVNLVVYTSQSHEEHVDSIWETFAEVIDPSRLRVVYLPGSGNGFWSRDAIPVPVFRSGGSHQETFTVVDARYYHGFEPDEKVSELFFAELTRHLYYFEGGNFVANSINQCLVVNTSNTDRIPDSVFLEHYGCQDLLRLPFLRGIGHADEVVKFVDDHTVLTDEPRYKDLLEQNGYRVVMLPRAQRKYETYVNSLFINGTAYVPIFGQPTDAEALEVYRQQGLAEVIGLDSVRLSNRGMGSIHCITMTYPPVDFNELMKSMGGWVLRAPNL
jgi:hypothetical protein